MLLSKLIFSVYHTNSNSNSKNIVKDRYYVIHYLHQSKQILFENFEISFVFDVLILYRCWGKHVNLCVY